MGNPALGIETAVLLKEESTPGTREDCSTGAEHLDLINETLDYKPMLFDGPVFAGDRQKRATMDFVTHHDGGGSVVCRPRSAQLENMLPLIFGAVDTDHVPITDDATDLKAFTVECTKSGQDQLALIGTKVNQATFRSEQNSPLELEMALFSLTGARNSGSFTSWAATQMDAEPVFMHGGLGFTSTHAWFDDGNTSYNPECRSIEIVCNNNLDSEAFTNSTDRRLLPPGLFELTGNIVVPYNATTKGFWADMVAATKVKFTATWTDADTSTFAIALVVKLEGDLPQISEAAHQWLTLNFHGVYDDTDAYCIRATNTPHV